MSTNKIEVPLSVREYYKNNGIHTAVDLLLEKNAPNRIPDDLDWDEVKNYHEALLSAVTVRTDFALMMMDAWDKVWKPALDGWDDVPIKDMEKDERPNPEMLWACSTLYRTRAHTRKNKELNLIWTAIEYDSLEKGFRIYVAIGELAKDESEKEIAFGNKTKDEWEEMNKGIWGNDYDEDGYLYTQTDTLHDIDELKKAAKDAVDFLT